MDNYGTVPSLVVTSTQHNYYQHRRAGVPQYNSELLLTTGDNGSREG